ncbi:hypothetical protein L596_007077 [Steinernema carpocapsae]|uniref:Uncharacterized protein n=1 Tax=Steinernema carpocapsae TaxID=34508 RepID=A0A4U5P971_STECR|nr:hypothetical protein L596_007077 [Steinernema carpocapsae]
MRRVTPCTLAGIKTAAAWGEDDRSWEKMGEDTVGCLGTSSREAKCGRCGPVIRKLKDQELIFLKIPDRETFSRTAK